MPWAPQQGAPIKSRDILANSPEGLRPSGLKKPCTQACRRSTCHHWGRCTDPSLLSENGPVKVPPRVWTGFDRRDCSSPSPRNRAVSFLTGCHPQPAGRAYSSAFLRQCFHPDPRVAASAARPFRAGGEDRRTWRGLQAARMRGGVARLVEQWAPARLAFARDYVRIRRFTDGRHYCASPTVASHTVPASTAALTGHQSPGGGR